MAEPGQIVLLNQRVGLLPDGQRAIYSASGSCFAQCCCTPKYIARRWLQDYGEYSPYWDLSYYQGPGKAPPGQYWRIIHLTHCHYFGQGCVDETGEMVGLPDSIYWPGVMYGTQWVELHTGCPNIGGETIRWYRWDYNWSPGSTCNSITAVIPC
jgi:hypothetical protein